MRDDWLETTLGEVADYINGYPFKPAELGNTGTPVIRIKQLLNPDGETDRSDISVPERAVLKDGDIVFSWSGTLAVRIWNRGHAYLNQHLFRVSAKDGISKIWLSLALEDAISDLSEKTHGTTMKHLTKRTLLRHKCSVPPLHEQHRIVDLVSSVDGYIDSLQRKVDATRAARGAVLEDLIKAGGEDWRETTLGEVADFVPGRYLPKEAYQEDGEFLIYGSNSVMGRYDRALVSGPHTIMAAVGANAGAIRFSEASSWINNNAFGIVARTGVLPQMLYYLLGVLLDGLQVTAGTGQPYVRRPVLKGARLAVPPLHEQHRIVDLVSSLDDATSAAEATLEHAKKLRSGLLSELLSGQHRIPETYDELMKGA